MSYTDIFGGAVVSPSYVNYASFNLTALNSPLTLVWPLQFENSTNVVAQIIDLTSDAGGRIVVMPDATLVSVGQSVLFTNRGANTITINAADNATLLASLASGDATYIYLTDNTTTNGTWNAVPWGTGTTAVISVGAVSTSNNLIITGSPITNVGTFTFSLSGNLDPIAGLTGTGYLARTGTNTWALRTYAGTVNQITISNPGGVAGTSTFALATNVSGINSLTAGNIQIGVNGTNRITTSNSGTLLIDEDLGIENQKGLLFFDGTDIGFVELKAPATVIANQTYTLPTDYPAFTGYVLSSTTAGATSWIANGSTPSNIVHEGSITNQISNPQFTDILFNNNFSYSISYTGSETTTVTIAPNWDLILVHTGAGSVTVSRTAIAGNANYISNPPYTLNVVPGVNLTSITLRQRLSNNPDIWSPITTGSAGYIYGSVVCSNNNTILMRYAPSSGTGQTIFTATNSSGVYAQLNGTVQLIQGDNTDTSTSGYVDILISLSTSISTNINLI